jgi:hypothetical protein
MAVRTESGNIRLQYGYLGDECERVFVIRGPGMVQPPDREMTEEEFDRWQFELTAGTDYSFEHSDTPIDSPLVEVKRTYEDQVPPGSMRAELLWPQNEVGQRTLAVRVTSEWDRPIPKFSLSIDFEHETPQPERLGNVPAQSLGGSEAMFRPMRPTVGGGLWPRVPVEYILDPRVLPVLRSRVAALSPERYWISLRTDGYEFDRIDGQTVGAFLERDEG